MTDKPIESPRELTVEKSDGIMGIRSEEIVDWRETLPAAEFCCWVVVLLAPILRWINGAAVTDDQFYMQIGLVTLALLGTVALRVANWRRTRQLHSLGKGHVSVKVTKVAQKIGISTRNV